MSFTPCLCTVRVGAARFGIETGEIREVLAGPRPQAVPLAPPFVAGVIPYRGDILCVLSVRPLLRLETPETSNNILVFCSPEHSELFGVAVDVVEGITAVEPDSWQDNPATLDPVSMRLLRGSCRDARGLIVRLVPAELAPARLLQNDHLAQRTGLITPETECLL